MNITIHFKKDCGCHSPAIAGRIFTKIGEVGGMMCLTASFTAGPVCELCGRPWLAEAEKNEDAPTEAPARKSGLLTRKEFMDRQEPGSYERTMDELRSMRDYAAGLKKKDHP